MELGEGLWWVMQRKEKSSIVDLINIYGVSSMNQSIF